jgi:hypothetical protein
MRLSNDPETRMFHEPRDTAAGFEAGNRPFCDAHHSGSPESGLSRHNSNFGVIAMFGTKRLLAVAMLMLVASLAKPVAMNWHHCGGKDQTAGCFKPSPLAQVKFFDLSTAKASER